MKDEIQELLIGELEMVSGGDVICRSSKIEINTPKGTLTFTTESCGYYPTCTTTWTPRPA